MRNAVVEILCELPELSPAIQREILASGSPEQQRYLAERNDLDPAVAAELWRIGDASTRATYLACSEISDAAIGKHVRQDGRATLVNHMLTFTERGGKRWARAAIRAMSEVACTKRSPRTALALFASSLPIPASATRALLAILADANVVLDAVAGSLTGTAAAAAALELINPSTLQMHTLNHLLAQTSPLSPATQATLVDSLLDRADEHAHSAVVVTIGSAPWVTSAAKATLHSAFPDIPFGTPAELADILAARIAQFTAQAGRKSTTSNDFERLTEILDIADQLAYTTRQLCRLRLDLALAVAARPGTGELLVDLAFDLDDTQLAAVFGQLVDPKAAQSLIRHRAEYAAYLFDHPFRDQVFAMLLKDAGDYYTSRAFRYMLNAKLITHELIATLPVEFAATSSTSLSAVLAYGAGLFADAPAALALYCDLVDQGGQLTIADIAQVARLTTTPLPTSPT